jgi:glutathione S-transferase
MRAPTQEMPFMSDDFLTRQFDVASSVLMTFMRGGLGVATRPTDARPAYLFELYDIEGCPYCRLVREALTELDLDATIYPCPKDGTRFRPVANHLGGKAQFPLLVDPNTGTRLYESADIVRYLFEHYGGGELPLHWQWIEVQKLGSGISSVPRLCAGGTARPSRAPAQPLELYSFESSPFARLVRETLCELELPYVLRSAGRSTMSDWVPPQIRAALGMAHEPETLNRRTLLQRAGSVSIPYLIDPNTGVELAESDAIIAYLESNYAVVETAAVS